MAQGLTLQQLQAMQNTTPKSSGLTLEQLQQGKVSQPQGNIWDKVVGGAKTLGDVLGGNMIGENIGTLSGYGITAGKEVLGFVPKGTTSQYDLSAPSVTQTAGDVLKIGTSLIPTVGIEATATKIASKIPFISKIAKGVGATAASGLVGYGQDVGTGFVNKEQNPFEAGVGTAVGLAVPPAIKALDTILARPAKAIYSQFNPSTVDAMTKALKPGGKKAKEFGTTISQVLPTLDAYTKELGTKITNIDELVNATKEIKKGVWDKFETQLGKTDTLIDGNLIANNIAQSISERTRLQNPSLSQKIQDVAESYKGFIKPQQAEDFLQEINAELESFYSKDPSARMNALKNPNTAYLVKEAQGLREGLYNAIDSVNGENVADVKKLYGHLSNFQDVAEKRAVVAGRQSPFNLAEQLSIPDALVAGGASLATNSFIPAVMGLGKVGLVKLLKEANSTDALITKSLQKYSKMTEPQQKAFISKVVTKLGGEERVTSQMLKYPTFKKAFEQINK
jgi:hypothetical protein